MKNNSAPATCQRTACADERAFFKWAYTHGLHPRIGEQIVAAWWSQKYRKGDLLFSQGDEPLGLFFLCAGTVKLVREDGASRRQILRCVVGPDWLGDRALLAGQPYAASAQVMRDSKICALNAEYFRDLWRKEPELAQVFARYLAVKVAAADEAAFDIAWRTISELLAKLITRRLESSGGSSIVFHESRQELAELIGTSAAVVSRALSEFGREGIVAIDGRHLKILDRVRLRAAARLPAKDHDFFESCFRFVKPGASLNSRAADRKRMHLIHSGEHGFKCSSERGLPLP